MSHVVLVLARISEPIIVPEAATWKWFDKFVGKNFVIPEGGYLCDGKMTITDMFTVVVTKDYYDKVLSNNPIMAEEVESHSVLINPSLDKNWGTTNFMFKVQMNHDDEIAKHWFLECFGISNELSTDIAFNNVQTVFVREFTVRFPKIIEPKQPIMFSKKALEYEQELARGFIGISSKTWVPDMVNLLEQKMTNANNFGRKSFFSKVKTESRNLILKRNQSKKVGETADDVPDDVYRKSYSQSFRPHKPQRKLKYNAEDPIIQFGKDFHM